MCALCVILHSDALKNKANFQMAQIPGIISFKLYIIFVCKPILQVLHIYIADGLATSCITVLSSLHGMDVCMCMCVCVCVCVCIMMHVCECTGRQRRKERNISKRDLQAAVKHGTKKLSFPCPKTGERRWLYTFADIVYVTDDTG